MAKPPAWPLADILRDTPLFATLTEAQRQRLLCHASQRHHRRHDLVLRRGEASRDLYLVLGGRAMETSRPAGGQGMVLFRYLGPGEHFGEYSLIDGQPCSAHVQCVTALDVLVIPGGQLAQVMVDNPAFALAIIQDLTRRLRRANRQIADLALGNVSARTLRALAEVSSEEHEQHWVLTRVSPTDIAAMVGASRESVSRAIRDLKRSGHLVNGGEGRLLLRRDAALAA
jgi:CRP/FNR family cyclic AMP-dependent transcriptional regulator